MTAPEYLWTSRSALWRYAPGRAEGRESAEPFRPEPLPVPYSEPFPWPAEPDWTKPVGIGPGSPVSSNGHRTAGGQCR